MPDRPWRIMERVNLCAAAVSGAVRVNGRNLIGGALFYYYECMVSAEDIREGILTLVQRKGPLRSISPVEIAQHLRPTQWREILDQVRLVIDSLIHEGKVKTIQKGDDVHIINP